MVIAQKPFFPKLRTAVLLSLDLPQPSMNHRLQGMMSGRTALDTNVADDARPCNTRQKSKIASLTPGNESKPFSTTYAVAVEPE